MAAKAGPARHSRSRARPGPRPRPATAPPFRARPSLSFNFVLRIHSAFIRARGTAHSQAVCQIVSVLRESRSRRPLSQPADIVNPARPLHRMLRRLGMLCGLLVLPTAVLAYADLLPDSLDLVGIDLRESPDLPHVARQIAIGAPLKIVAFGSSSTQGVGASSPANAYPARLQSDLRKRLRGSRRGGHQPRHRRRARGRHAGPSRSRRDRGRAPARHLADRQQRSLARRLDRSFPRGHRGGDPAHPRGRHRRRAHGAAMVPEARSHPGCLALPRSGAQHR